MDKVSIVEEGKIASFHVADGKFYIEIDPNKDGKPLMVTYLDIGQIPSEVASIFVKK